VERRVLGLENEYGVSRRRSEPFGASHVVQPLLAARWRGPRFTDARPRLSTPSGIAESSESCPGTLAIWEAGLKSYVVITVHLADKRSFLLVRSREHVGRKRPCQEIRGPAAGR